ncbi:MAG: pyridoxamine 5'-phosphate oxidase [Flavobacteriaceae bacterium]|jgi:pyridoxamine 5'-phosphate oxidase|nr:pyridoxamine 5'-phosphate oxidase [Flavobacteriaceae bacterium]|tara:strand:- start:1794 stop:2438 length:645 start_codon:yes stop_codon:yes gene_type:complete
MQRDVSALRKSYSKMSLSKNEVPDEPIKLFDKWFSEIKSSTSLEVNAMTLSTIDNEGYPKGRVVLLKHYSDEGFIFFTNYNSEKSISIKNNNKVSISFFWEDQERQVIIKGFAKKTSEEISSNYFNSRPKGSKLGALVSENQSAVIKSKQVLIDKFNELKDEYKNKEISRPLNWGGYIVSPVEYEFWQGGENRLHDRIRFKLIKNNWLKERLSP